MKVVFYTTGRSGSAPPGTDRAPTVDESPKRVLQYQRLPHAGNGQLYPLRGISLPTVDADN